jgi:ABC-type nitrate/sulfonate/bicarbonate transport system permease component
MHALDIKLLRDFRRLWAQALAIALVLACGVLVVLTAFGMYGALETTRAAYYERQRFADVFAEANRAPNSLLPALAAIDGVLGVDARVSGLATLDVPGGVPLAVGQVLSLPADDGELNRLVLRAGRMPEPGATDQIVVNAPFAEANGLRPGDRLTANLDGRQRVLTVTGTALSPEFIYTIGPGALMPDNRRFGILWMPTAAAAAAFDMEGAFNKLALRLAAGADTPAVIAAVDRLLDPYGGLGAHGRDLQVSNSFIDAELQQLQSTAWVLPPVFFLVAAFLVNMVIGRIVELERAEIGLLKALGYRDRAVLGHYLLLAGLIALTGIAIGWIVGSWLAAQTAALYATFFDFPFLIHTVSPAVYGLSALLGLAAAGFGAALLVDRSDFLRRGLMPIGALVSALPIIGIAPIMVMWFGFDWPSKAAVVIVMVFFPMLVNTVQGLQAADRMQRDLMRTYAASYRQSLLKLRLPAAAPFIFNALKITSTLALIGAIVAEFFGTPIVGMGFRISTEVGRMNVDMVWAEIAVAALAGSGFYGLIALVERRVTFWSPAIRR